MIDWSSNDPYNSYNNMYYNDYDTTGIYLNKDMNLDNQFSQVDNNKSKIDNNKSIKNIDDIMPSIYISNEEIKNNIDKNEILSNLPSYFSNNQDNTKKTLPPIQNINECFNNRFVEQNDVETDYNNLKGVIPSTINYPIKNVNEGFNNKKNNFVSSFGQLIDGNNFLFMLFILFIILIYTEIRINNFIKIMSMKVNEKNNT